ncbi:MAG: choice-of-anchor D domain-containing protein, partial [Chloroflexi bacterium]|nr:choice-of-anchor D domain-containing protein [Chloroflexota bacterium]
SATDPEITVAPLSLTFGNQNIDAGATVSQTVTITNDGTANLTISDVTPTGDTGEFNLIDSGESTLTPGNTRTIEVSFDPSSVGAKAVTLTIQSDDGDESTVDVSLDGTGTSATDPEITVAPLSLVFGNQNVDAGATVSQTVVITNDGGADLHISAVTPTGDTGEFNLTDSGEITLPFGSTRTIEVSFDPSSIGAKAVTLTIQSDDADEPTVNVTLSGTGVTQPAMTPPVLVSPADGTLTSTTSLTLTWQAVTSATGYWLDWNGTVSNRGNVTEYATGVLADGTYTWTVAAYDALNNTSAYTDVWSFTVDATAPTVTLVGPTDGATDVPRNAPIEVDFSEAMATGSVSYTIMPAVTGLAPTWENGDRRLWLGHDELATSTRYTVSVDTGSDLVGNPLGNAPYTWVFATGAISVREADLSLGKVRVGTGDVTAGERITYTLTITNAGPTSPVTATLVDTFSDAAALAGVGGTGCAWAWTSGETDVTCTVTDVISGTPANLTLVVTTTSTFSGTLNNTASVSPVGGVLDLYPDNDDDDASVRIVLLTGDNYYIYLPLVLRNS